jgi:16S rRNA (cytosine967-C5)-methyltransferase
MPVSPARAVAFDILLRVEQQDAYASELLHSERCDQLGSLDQALATELVMGVLRWRSALDDAIAAVSAESGSGSIPSSHISSPRRVQLGWLDRVPARAAINEASNS